MIKAFFGSLLRLLIFVLTFVILTALTQTGGVVFLISYLISSAFIGNIGNRPGRILFHVFVFCAFYVFSALWIVPKIAPLFGRYALPQNLERNVKPHNILTCLGNRHYVRMELMQATFSAAKKLDEKYPGTVLHYLDASFPFYDGFPLLPHKSHNDGKKLDVAFFYNEKENTAHKLKHPSWLGYGVSEEPLPGEVNTPEECASKGKWQYSVLKRLVSQNRKDEFEFDEERTRDLVKIFAKEERIGAIFIEPHLRERLSLKSNKVRFHGCEAVRHDDHLHVQLLN